MVTTMHDRTPFRLAANGGSPGNGCEVAHQGCVLVIEDDLRTTRLERFVLEEEGCTVVSAGSGEEALKLLGTISPQLVLLDVGLPGMDGFTTCRRIREFSQVPIIMVTGNGDEADVVQGLEAGADDYVTKPFSPGILVARMRSLLRRAAGRATPTSTAPAPIKEPPADSPTVIPPPASDGSAPPVAPEPPLEQLYEGNVRLQVEATGQIRQMVRFVDQLRQMPQLRLLRLVASPRQDGAELWLGLREPVALPALLYRMDGVTQVVVADAANPGSGEWVLKVLLAGPLPKENSSPAFAKED